MSGPLNQTRTGSRLRRAIGLVTLLGAALAISAPAAIARQAGAGGSGGALAELNGRVTAGPGWKSAAAELFPKMAAMSPAPEQGMGERQATLMTPKSAEWKAWTDWAAAEPQQAALEALKTVTDPKQRYVLGLPYGEAGVDPQWISAGLFVDLGRPPLVGRAPRGMSYLDELTQLVSLCTIEAARQAEAGNGEAAVRVVTNWMRLARMVADREFQPEKYWGMSQIISATERLRDIAFQYPDLLTESNAKDAVTELDQRALTPDRIRFPDGERLALLELLSMTMQERGGPDGAKFAATMGRLTAEGRSFNAFSQAAHWSELEPTHAGWFDTRDEITKVFGDWQQRWDLNNIYDAIMREPTDFAKMDPLKFAMIEHLVEDMESLFDLRVRLRVAVTGTRTAMGVVGFRARFKQWPPNLPAVQPQFVPSLDYDPWSFDQKLGTYQIFRYFVPVRDAVVGPREVPGPHTMQVLIVRDEALVGSDGSDADPLNGLFPPFAARAFRDALADGIPSGLFNSAGELQLGAFRTHLATELDKLAIEAVTLKSLKEMASKMDEASALAIVALIDPSKATGPGGIKLSEEQKAFGRQVTDILLGDIPEELRGADGALDPAKFRTVATERIKNSAIPPEAKDALVAELEKISDVELTQIFESMRSLAGGADGPMLSFTAELTDKTFVIYSVGRDGRPGGARAVGNAAGAVDIIVFPAPISLERQHLSQAR